MYNVILFAEIYTPVQYVVIYGHSTCSVLRTITYVGLYRWFYRLTWLGLRWPRVILAHPVKPHRGDIVSISL